MVFAKILQAWRDRNTIMVSIDDTSMEPTMSDQDYIQLEEISWQRR